MPVGSRVLKINNQGIVNVFEEPIPEPQPQQILIRVKSVALTSVDKIAIAKQDFFQTQPSIECLGFACTGIVEKIGSNGPKECPFGVGDEVVGFLPPNCGGCLRDYVCQYWFYFVKKPISVTHDIAAASIVSGLKAYSSILIHLKIVAGESLLILDAASFDGYLAAQVASTISNAKVLAVVSNSEEKEFLAQQPTLKLDKILVLSEIPSNISFFNVVLKNTGGLGVDSILDTLTIIPKPKAQTTPAPATTTATTTATQAQTQPPQTQVLTSPSPIQSHPPTSTQPTTTTPSSSQQTVTSFSTLTTLDFVNSLGANSRWLTQSSHLHLHSSYSNVLHLKSASVIFHSILTWTLNNSQQGRFLTILNDFFERLGRQQLFVAPSSIESKTASNAQAAISQFLSMSENQTQQKAFVIKMS